jgi:hypothetical protein
MIAGGRGINFTIDDSPFTTHHSPQYALLSR